MAHFYGTIDGSAKTQGTRCGTKKSGLTTHAASWQGAVKVRVWYHPIGKCDMCEVSLVPWKGAGVRHVIYRGPIGQYHNGAYTFDPANRDKDSKSSTLRLTD